MKYLAPLFLLLGIMSCEKNTAEQVKLDLQGHRGCRGLLPENSIAGFIHAIDLGVATLEMDVVVDAENELIVSHEPFMSAEICLMPNGDSIPDSAQYELNIYKMNYSEIMQFDAGMKPHPRFTEQKKLPSYKPKLQAIMDTVEAYTAANNRQPIRYNIELKSTTETDTVYHPIPSEFVQYVFEEIDSRVGWERVTLQSFDFRVLQEIHQKYPDITLSLLIENELPFQENLDSLGFTPDVYSCEFVLLSQSNVKDLQKQGIKVIPWTVNEVADMQKLVEWGVDGLISDYPDRFKKIK
jgi:glycerophosphoryl diester phosphodiesterase